MHCHAVEQEDIICRAGGNLVPGVQPPREGGLDDSDVSVSLDGVATRVAAGHSFVLRPGKSIRLTPFLHEFYAEPGSGVAIIGEVSSVNDDATDNHFLAQQGRLRRSSRTRRRNICCARNTERAAMTNRHIIAFDAGGTAVKAAIYDERGEELAVAAAKSRRCIRRRAVSNATPRRCGRRSAACRGALWRRPASPIVSPSSGSPATAISSCSIATASRPQRRAVARPAGAGGVADWRATASRTRCCR